MNLEYYLIYFSDVRLYLIFNLNLITVDRYEYFSRENLSNISYCQNRILFVCIFSLYGIV